MGDLEEALARTNNIPKLHFIEVALPRLDAPESLMRSARRAAEFDFPQIRRLSAVHALDLRGRGMSTTLASITNN